MQKCTFRSPATAKLFGFSQVRANAPLQPVGCSLTEAIGREPGKLFNCSNQVNFYSCIFGELIDPNRGASVNTSITKYRVKHF